ncbi:ribonuclease H-like domain-containing protein [Tanacetum coccineum]
MVGSSSSEDLISSLDLGNPLHLQNSDFNANTIISVKLTGTENDKVWAAAMKLAINTRNKTGFINGTCAKSAYANSALLFNHLSEVVFYLEKIFLMLRMLLLLFPEKNLIEALPLFLLLLLGNLNAICFVSKSLWHNRLGYPSDKVVEVFAI